MKKIITMTAIALVIGGFAGSAMAEDKQAANPAAAKHAQKQASEESTDFVKTASEANKFEIDSSKLALTKSRNADVREFAKQMITDHSKAGKSLALTLPKSSVSRTVVATRLSPEHQEEYNNLKASSGKDFDDLYISLQKDAHEEAVDLFSDYSENGDDKALQQFASNTLPALEKHKEHINDLAE